MRASRSGSRRARIPMWLAARPRSFSRPPCPTAPTWRWSGRTRRRPVCLRRTRRRFSSGSMPSSAPSGCGRSSSASVARSPSIRHWPQRASRRSAPGSPCARATCTRRTNGFAWWTSIVPSPPPESGPRGSPRLAEVAAEVQEDVLERLLRYVRIDTTSDQDSETYPSPAKQRALGEVLERELREIGLDDVELTEHGYVFATLP